MIPFNQSYLTGDEAKYMHEAMASHKLCGNGPFTQKCQDFFKKRYGFKQCLLTTSGTDALEMAALLTEVGPGDEVIVPSYTFVSTALAFIRTGATVVFADSRCDEPNIDADALESLITPRTKVIVPVHYAGFACDMDRIMSLAAKYNLLVVEDAAQAIDSYYSSSQVLPAPAPAGASPPPLPKRSAIGRSAGRSHRYARAFVFSHPSASLKALARSGSPEAGRPRSARKSSRAWRGRR